MLQCVVACCSVSQCDAVCSSLVQCVAVRYIELQRVTVCCSLKYIAVSSYSLSGSVVAGSLQRVAACCSVLQCVSA